MTKILTDINWQELKVESEQKGILSIQSKGAETIRHGKILDICNTYYCGIELRNGLFIRIHQEDFVDDLVWIRDSLDESRFGLSFFLSGKVRIERHGLTDETDESVGKYYSECNCDIKETEYWKAGQKYSRIYLGIKPQEFFQSFAQEDLEQIPIYLRQALIGGKLQPDYHQGKITRQMRRVLNEILQLL